MSRRLLMAASGGGGTIPAVWTRGTVTPDGSPQTIVNDGLHNAFAGVARLDVTRCLLVYRRGTNHLAGGEIYGRIGTISGTSVSWGSGFLIYTNAEDVRCQDGVSIVDNQVVVVADLYNGTANHSPFLLIATAAPASFTSGTTWGSPISIPLTVGATQNLCIAYAQKLGNGKYALGYNSYSGATSTNGILTSTSLSDWSAMTRVEIGNGFTELEIIQETGANLTAHLRAESPKVHHVATSSDYGATWTSPASLFTAWGLPMFRILTSGLRLAVHRTAASPWDTYWRQSADDGATWSSQTLLDGQLIGGGVSDSAYATLLQLDSNHVLCVYAIENSSDDPGSPASLFSQVFTDSSVPH